MGRFTKKNKPKAAHQAQKQAEKPVVEEEKPEKMQGVTFQMEPKDYERLKTLAREKRIGIGAMIRMALMDFMKQAGEK